MIGQPGGRPVLQIKELQLCCKTAGDGICSPVLEAQIDLFGQGDIRGLFCIAGMICLCHPLRGHTKQKRRHDSFCGALQLPDRLGIGGHPDADRLTRADRSQVACALKALEMLQQPADLVDPPRKAVMALAQVMMPVQNCGKGCIDGQRDIGKFQTQQVQAWIADQPADGAQACLNGGIGIIGGFALILTGLGSVAQIGSGDSSRESSMVAGRHEQTYTPDLQDQKLASLQ